jgi:hypothetical protein
MLRVLLPVALCAAVLLTACDSGGSVDIAASEGAPTAVATAPNDPAALQAVTNAAAATAEEGTVHFTVTVETEGTGGADGVQPVSADGEEDFAAEQRHITFHSPAGDLEAIVDGTDIYVQLPGTEDGNWARANLDELISGDVGFGGPAGLPFRSSADNLEVLGDAVTYAASGQEEDLEGEATTRYDLTVDLAQSAQEAAEANDTMAAVAEQSGLRNLAMQVWVGNEGLIRRVAYGLDLSQADVPDEDLGADVEPGGSVTVTLDYADYGAPVAIELPDDSLVVDIDEKVIRGSLTVPSSAEATS